MYLPPSFPARPSLPSPCLSDFGYIWLSTSARTATLIYFGLIKPMKLQGVYPLTALHGTESGNGFENLSSGLKSLFTRHLHRHHLQALQPCKFHVILVSRLQRVQITIVFFCFFSFDLY